MLGPEVPSAKRHVPAAWPILRGLPSYPSLSPTLPACLDDVSVSKG